MSARRLLRALALAACGLGLRLPPPGRPAVCLFEKEGESCHVD